MGVHMFMFVVCASFALPLRSGVLCVHCVHVGGQRCVALATRHANMANSMEAGMYPGDDLWDLLGTRGYYS